MKKKQKAAKLPAASKRTPSSRASTTSTVNPSKWIRIEQPFPIPGYVKEAIDRLDDAGHVAYVVGGCVRDFLLKREAKDHDVATSASPDEIVRLFPQAITVGKAFGVLKIPVDHPPRILEVATFREDMEYKDHRRPTGILFSGPEGDARRRDFTVNALFYDPKTSRILDTVGGMDDIKAKVIRAIGDPNVRFREDALRLLRAVRFTTRFDFKLDPKTAEAIQARARLIQKISPERIRDELTLMWTGNRPGDSLRMLADLGLLEQVLPEISALRAVKGWWTHALKVLDHLSRQAQSRSIALGWASVLHDIGKPIARKRSDGKSVNGHERFGAELAEKVALRMKLPGEEVELIRAMVEDHMKFKDVFQMREATLQRLIRESHFEELLALHKADATATDGNLVYFEFCASRLKELRKQPEGKDVKLISGEDLIQLGLKPGPKFSEILRTIEDLTLERKLKSKEEALEYVVRNFVG